MKLPNPRKANRLPAYPGGTDKDVQHRFMALDAKVRKHNMARRVAAMTSLEDRQVWLRGMDKRFGKVFMEQFRKLVSWYWAAQRRAKARAKLREKAAA